MPSIPNLKFFSFLKLHKIYTIKLQDKKMGAKDRKPVKQTRQANNQDPEIQSSDEQSNDTFPLPALQQLSLNQRKSNETVAPQKIIYNQQFYFLKKKPIKKRIKNNQQRQKSKNKSYIAKLQRRIQELQTLIQEFKVKENACPHCHFYISQSEPTRIQRRVFTPQANVQMLDCYKRSTSKDSLEFEKINFLTPLMCNPEMQEKSWIFLGTIMIAMGSKVMDYDGTINVFKIVKESVDKIRRQVQKSQQKLNMDFFLAKEEFMQEMRTEELNFDPFFNKEQNLRGLQLQGVRVQSVQQYDLYFDQKLNFSVQYQALITVMQYLKENSTISYS